MWVENSLNDKIITRHSENWEKLPEINKSLLNIIWRPISWNAVKDFLKVFEDESKYSDEIKRHENETHKNQLEKEQQVEQEIEYLLNKLDDDDPIYELNSKVKDSKEQHPELSEGRIEDVFYFDENVYFDYDEDEDEYTEYYSNILLDIQDNYERAISRHSNYVADLKAHIASWNWLVYSPFVNDESVLVWQLQWDIFLVSHFAPSSIKMWYNLIKHASNCKMPMVFAVPDFLAKQLTKAWFKDLWYQIPQIFNWEIVMKNVVVNNAVTEDDIRALIENFSNEYLWFSI